MRVVEGNRTASHHLSFQSGKVLQRALPCKLPPSHSFFSLFFLSLFPLSFIFPLAPDKRTKGERNREVLGGNIRLKYMKLLFLQVKYGWLLAMVYGSTIQEFQFLQSMPQSSYVLTTLIFIKPLQCARYYLSALHRVSHAMLFTSIWGRCYYSQNFLGYTTTE